MVKDPAKVSIKVEGIRELSRDALKFGVSLSDMKAFNYRMAKPIERLARQLAPVSKRSKHPGNLRAGIKASRSKLRIAVNMGNETSLPYGAVVHWGRDGKSGPKFISKAEEQLRPQILAGYDKEIHDLLRKQGWL